MSFSFFLLADKITETLLYRRSRSRLTGKYEEKKNEQQSWLPKPKIMAIFFYFSPQVPLCVCVCVYLSVCITLTQNNDDN